MAARQKKRPGPLQAAAGRKVPAGLPGARPNGQDRPAQPVQAAAPTSPIQEAARQASEAMRKAEEDRAAGLAASAAAREAEEDRATAAAQQRAEQEAEEREQAARQSAAIVRFKPRPPGQAVPPRWAPLSQAPARAEMKRIQQDEEAGCKRDFLRAYEEGPYVVSTCRQIGVPYHVFRRWERDDPEFAEQVRELEQLHVDTVRREVFRRAVDGWDEPVFYQGQQVSERHVYSDLLLIIEAKRRDPQYRERAVIDTNVEVKLYEGVDPERV